MDNFDPLKDKVEKAPRPHAVDNTTCTQLRTAQGRRKSTGGLGLGSRVHAVHAHDIVLF